MEKNKKNHGTYRTLTVLGVIAAFLTSILAAITFIIQSGLKKINVEAQILSSEMLTMLASEAELSAHFRYAGEEVANLWKIKIRFVNSGDKTILGTGSMKNILSDGIRFAFPDNTRVLRIQREDENFSNTLKELDNNQFQIQFLQWRKDEYLISCFFIASEEMLTKDPFPIVKGRDIIDGDVFIKDMTRRETLEKLFLIDRFPKFISLPGKILAIILSVGFIIFLIIRAIIIWKGTIIYRKWFDNYQREIINILDEAKPPISKKLKEKYLKAPHWEVPEKYSKKLKAIGPEAFPDFETVKAVILATIGIVIVIFGCINVIFMIIPA